MKNLHYTRKITIFLCIIFLLFTEQHFFAHNHYVNRRSKMNMHSRNQNPEILFVERIISSVNNNFVEIIIVFNQPCNPFEINKDIISINYQPLPKDTVIKYNKTGNEMFIRFSLDALPPLSDSTPENIIQGVHVTRELKNNLAAKLLISISYKTAMQETNNKMNFEMHCGETIFFRGMGHENSDY